MRYPQALRREELLRQFSGFFALALALTMLGACAASGPGPAQLGFAEGESEACVPGAVGQPLLVGDWLVVNDTSDVVVVEVGFESSSGITVLEQAVFATHDGHGYTVYPLSGLNENHPELWPSRTVVPSNQVAPLWEGMVDGELRRQTTVVAVVARTGEEVGIVKNLRVRYESAGRAYTTSNQFTYIIGAGVCT